MHELGIVREMIETIRKEALSHGLSRVKRARLKIGMMAAFRPEQLQFCLEAFERDSLIEKMKLEVEEEAVELKCGQCNAIRIDARFEDAEFAHETAHNPIAYELPACPSCGAKAGKLISGQGLRLVELEGE